jgi:hypothetical protein
MKKEIVDPIVEGSMEVTDQKVADVPSKKGGTNKKLVLIGKVKENDQDVEISGTMEAGLWIPSGELTSHQALGKLCKSVGIDAFDDAEKQFVGKTIPVARNKDTGMFWRVKV